MLQFLEYGLDLELLSLSADDYRYRVSYFALPYKSDELTAAGDLLAVERYDTVLCLEASLLSVLAGYLCDVYACGFEAVVLSVLF